MFSLLQNEIIFLILTIFILFLPGYFLLLAIFPKNKPLSQLENFIASFGLSIISVDFIFFAYAKLNIIITRLSSIIGIGIFILVCYLIYVLRLKFSKKNINSSVDSEAEKTLFNFSKNQLILILILLFFTVFIKTTYLTGSILPTATDMGHHMYWTQWMAQNGQLPTYEGMPDFIIGEHIIFGLFALVGGLSVFFAFPPLILFLVNMFSILAVFILVLRIFKQKNIAILSLLFLGVLYAVASPQAKFVSGGVIGNILGNFFIPLSFYFYYRAFEFWENNAESNAHSKAFLALAFFATSGLFYTHHLTSFVFLFIALFLIMLFSLLNIANVQILFKKILKIFFSPQALSALFLGIVFFFFVFTPNYVNTSAVETAVGTPEKNTRVGLSLNNIESSVGNIRLALGFLGIILLALNFKIKNIGYSIIAAWTVMLFIMSAKPNWLFIDLPSNRIGNYLTYPLAILSAYSFFTVFRNYKNYFSNILIKSAFILVLTFVFLGGIFDSIIALKENIDFQKPSQTFAASAYLAEKTATKDIIVKDHNYLEADAWIKLFFMRGYKYPLSRGFFKRYEDNPETREQCTLHMISNPGGESAQKCFRETGTNFIMLNPQVDSAQFKKLSNFDQIYLSNDLAIFYRN